MSKDLHGCALHDLVADHKHEPIFMAALIYTLGQASARSELEVALCLECEDLCQTAVTALALAAAENTPPSMVD